MTIDEPVVSARFWGKIFGTRANYIVAEAEFQEGEGEEEEKNENREEESAEGAEDEADLDNDSSESEKDEPPKSQWKPPPVVPKEELKTGANKKTYFVCNNRKYTTILVCNAVEPLNKISREVNKENVSCIERLSIIQRFPAIVCDVFMQYHKKLL